jgi:DNA invertase Pin-like site-specific DNA recombinase
VALDCAVDTSTPAGEAMAHVLATFGQFERRLIGQRMKEALAAKKAAGVRLGRPPKVPQAVVRRIQRQRARGDSFRKIAEDLNQAGVHTAQGGAQWYAATVRHVLLRTSQEGSGAARVERPFPAKRLHWMEPAAAAA